MRTASTACVRTQAQKLNILSAGEMSPNPLICRYAFRTKQRRKEAKLMGKNRLRKHKFTLYLSDDEHWIFALNLRYPECGASRLSCGS